MADVNLTYLHPSIVSNIDAEETTYPVADGVTTLFVADTFEKGPDNKVGLVTSPEEFLFKYGDPNYTKYGQAAYNVLGWLENNGQAYVLRVLPSDAQYAHAILNVQTKVDEGKKTIGLEDGTMVNIDDVSIRPVISYLISNNTDITNIKNELNRVNNNETVDGYKDNLVLAVYPTGRGSSYNNLGFRLSLNTSYDSMQDARVYNFEVVKFDESYNTTVVEGPFYVTFDSDALTSSNESMFIENVVNRYSEYLRVAFNTDNYLKVAKTINSDPDVDPAIIDIISGVTRKNLDGSAETYYDTTAKTNFDIHISLMKYTSEGKQVKSNGEAVYNITDSSSIIDEAVISMDNEIRSTVPERDTEKLELMKDYYPTIFTKLDDTLNSVYDPDTNTGDLVTLIADVTDADADTTRKAFDDSVTLFKKDDTTNTEENAAKVAMLSDKMSIQYNNILENCNKINAAGQLVCGKVDTDFTLYQNQIIKALSNKDMIDITVVSHKSDTLDISSEFLALKSGNVGSDLTDELVYLSTLIKDEIDYTKENLIPSVYADESTIPEVISDNFVGDTAEVDKLYASLNEILSDCQEGYLKIEEQINDKVTYKYTEATITDDTPFVGDKYFLFDGKDYVLINERPIDWGEGFECYTREVVETVLGVYSLIEIVLDDLVEAYTLARIDGLNNSVISITAIVNSIDESAQSVLMAIAEDKTISDTKTESDIKKAARNNIDLETSSVITIKSELYNNNLQDFDNPIKLTMGSDGSFEYSTDNTAERNKKIKNELIKAYRGQVDVDITNKKLIVFDHIMDANYDTDIKNAIVTLARDIRGDFFYWADTGLQPSPEDVLTWRRNLFNVASRYVGIFAQDMTFYDSYTGKDIKFTTPYVLSKKVPFNAVNYGLHYPIAGPRRGLVDGFKSICWSPNESYKEELYKAKVNYIEQDTKRTKIGSQLTTDSKNGPLSNINNVLTILKLQRNVEQIVEDYQFEFNDDETRNALYYELNDYVSTYITNRSCETISVEVVASDYDKQQKIVRVNLTVKFNDVIERIVLNFSVQK